MRCSNCGKVVKEERILPMLAQVLLEEGERIGLVDKEKRPRTIHAIVNALAGCCERPNYFFFCGRAEDGRGLHVSEM